MSLSHGFEPVSGNRHWMIEADSPDAALSTFQHGVCDGVEGLEPCDDPFVGDCE